MKTLEGVFLLSWRHYPDSRLVLASPKAYFLPLCPQMFRNGATEIFDEHFCHNSWYLGENVATIGIIYSCICMYAVCGCCSVSALSPPALPGRSSSPPPPMNLVLLTVSHVALGFCKAPRGTLDTDKWLQLNLIPLFNRSFPIQSLK